MTEKIIICTDTHVNFIPYDAEPEAFAGYMGDDIRVYIPITIYHKIPKAVLETLRAYEYVKAVDIRHF